MVTYPGYERVVILDVPAKVRSQQIFYNKQRAEYSIERTCREVGQSHLAPLLETDREALDALLEHEKRVFDAQDRLDDEGKEAGR